MKKVFFTASAILFMIVAANAQTKAEAAGKNASNESATDPLVNGIPYSQYKAQQAALKQQQQSNKKAVLPSDIVSVNVNAADLKPAPTKAQPVAGKPSNGVMVDDGKTDVLKAAIEKAKLVKEVQETVGKKLPEVSNAEPQTTNLALPAKTTDPGIVTAKPVAAKEISPAQPSTIPELKVVQIDAEPAATKPTEVKPTIAPSSDSKQQLPAKKN